MNPPRSGISFLGSHIAFNHQSSEDISRKLSKINGRVMAQKTVWATKAAPVKKLRYLNAQVQSILMYGLNTLRLTQAQRSALDRAQLKCFRRALRCRPNPQELPEDYYRRTKNICLNVMTHAKIHLWSEVYLGVVFDWFGHVARLPVNRMVRRVLFEFDVPQIRTLLEDGFGLGRNTRAKPWHHEEPVVAWFFNRFGHYDWKARAHDRVFWRSCKKSFVEYVSVRNKRTLWNPNVLVVE